MLWAMARSSGKSARVGRGHREHPCQRAIDAGDWKRARAAAESEVGQLLRSWFRGKCAELNEAAFGGSRERTGAPHVPRSWCPSARRLTRDAGWY